MTEIVINVPLWADLPIWFRVCLILLLVILAEGGRVGGGDK